MGKVQSIRKHSGKFGWLALFLACLFTLNSLGISLHIKTPWSNKSKTTISAAGPIEVPRIDPETLDCRALIHEIVPVKGKKVHQLSFVWHWDYRKDTVYIKAIGDVDTCVNGGADIQSTPNGGWLVNIPSASIDIHRPRVDMVATAGNINFKKGLIGKITDAAWWVSENNKLTPAALAYAQELIGNGKCLQAAWNNTWEAIQIAYFKQAAAKGIDSSKVKINLVVGTPNFNQNKVDLTSATFKGYKFDNPDNIECRVSASVLGSNNGRR